MMKIFIAGATGVLGQRLVPRLIERGYEVIGLSRSHANTLWLTEIGAEARTCDLFDRDSVLEATRGADIILHLATSIPSKARTSKKDWAVNDRIRRDGTQNLLAAAKEHKTKLYLQQSIVFIYENQHGGLADENTKLSDNGIDYLTSAVDMEEMVRFAIDNEQLPATVLRFGSFYGADSALTRRTIEALQNGFFPTIADGSYIYNIIHIEDAVRAIELAIRNHEDVKGKVFNVTDGTPVRASELYVGIAAMLGAPQPKQIPVWSAQIMLGKNLTRFLTLSTQVNMDAFKKDLGFQPRYSNYQAGYAQVLPLMMSMDLIKKTVTL